jgi:hypothetical protein
MKNNHIPTFKENVDAFVLKASKALKLSDDLFAVVTYFNDLIYYLFIRKL